jgi:diguanylate cyclase (GGDEF)-like protein
MLGCSVGQLNGQRQETIVAPEFRADAEIIIQRRLQGETGRPGEARFVRRDGSTLDVRVLARRIDFEGRAAVMVTLFDISELKAALNRAEWNGRMLERTEALCRAGSFEMAWPGGLLRMSAGLAALLGQPADAPREAQLDDLAWVPADERAYVAGIWRHATPGEPFEFQHRVLCADGRRLAVLHRGQLGADGHGVALLQDVTEQGEAARRITELATHHEITGLPNRAWLLDQVDAAIHAARWEGEERGFALLALDFARIAEVKATMGFGAGDTLCMALAFRLREAAGDGALIAQLGDTEFALMLNWPDGPRDGALDALRQRALALQQALQAPVRLGATDIYAQCVVGIAGFPADGDSAARLLENAQTARLDVQGTQGVAWFRPESTARAVRAMELESALWRALQRDEFRLHYQPQVNLDSGAVCGAEALLRWTSPELGMVSPGEFIPVAERSGLIGAIGEWVLRQTCTQLAAWHAAGLPAVRVAVNLAASQLQQPDLASHVQALLLETGADPACLGIEITESMVMADVEGAAATLRAIKAMGVQISLDDFGTGFSSLSCLSRLPIDVVKVDRSFVHDVMADAQDVSVTRAIIHMTHGLQMRALAEGVETEGQLALLSAAGCDEFQGYWFSKPVPAPEFEALLRAGKRLPERYLRQPGVARQPTLLLVDDEENILSALKRLLRRDGYRIITATSAEQGLQRLAEETIDVIVSDQRMPGMTGVEFLLRAKALYPHTLRLVLSGYTELQSIIDAVNQGAIYKFLTKPWDDERLRSHIAEAFHQKGLGDENRRLTEQVDRSNADLAQVNDKLAGLLEQQREQAELMQASAGSLRAVFEALPVPVLGVDGDGCLVFVNEQAEQLLPELGAQLGGDGLPAALLAMPADARPRPLWLGRRRFDVLGSPLPAAGAVRGRLLMLLPHAAGGVT